MVSVNNALYPRQQLLIANADFPFRASDTSGVFYCLNHCFLTAEL